MYKSRLNKFNNDISRKKKNIFIILHQNMIKNIINFFANNKNYI